MKELYRLRTKNKNNEKFLSVVNHNLSLRNYEIVKGLIKNSSDFKIDSSLKTRMENLFILDNRAKEFFGIGANIVNTMSNIVFAGNVNVKVADEKIQDLLDELYFDGYFIDTLKEAYKTAIACNDGISYIFMNTSSIYENETEVKIGENFLDFEVFPSYEVEVKRNKLVRTFYKAVWVLDKELLYKFEYHYETLDGITYLTILGFNDKGVKLSNGEVKKILDIDIVKETYDYVPYTKIDMGIGMLPNALWIENSLAENLYYQDEDLRNSQTHTYTPESMLNESVLSGVKNSWNDKYETQHVIAQGGIDEEKIVVVEGKSAITEIEKNLALNVIQASIDAQISPLSLNYSLVDKIASNTDNPVQKERQTIRTRENHVERLKVDISQLLSKRLKISGIELSVKEITIIFDPYVTPSFESMVNTLSKAVQFGIMSRFEAVKRLNKNELSDKEVELEYERIKELATQMDYNTNQQNQARKGTSNVLKDKENEGDDVDKEK